MHFANKLAALTAAIVMTFVSTVSASADHRRQHNDAAIVIGTMLTIAGIAIASSDRGGRHHSAQPVYGYQPPHPSAWHPTPPSNHYVLRQPPPQHFGHPTPHRGSSLPPLRRVIDRDGNVGFVTPNGVSCGAYGMYAMLSFTRGSTFMRTICYH